MKKERRDIVASTGHLWQGYILELSFDEMSISSCSGCSCGYVKVRDGSSSSDPLLGNFCDYSSAETVTSTGNHLFVEFYSQNSWSNFQATVRSKKGNIYLECSDWLPFIQIEVHNNAGL